MSSRWTRLWTTALISALFEFTKHNTFSTITLHILVLLLVKSNCANQKLQTLLISTFCERYNLVFCTDLLLKHLEDRGWPQYYHHYMVASVNNCHTLADNFTKLKSEFACDSQGSSSPFDDESPILEYMEFTAQKGCQLLCEEVMLDLKVTIANFIADFKIIDSHYSYCNNTIVQSRNSMSSITLHILVIGHFKQCQRRILNPVLD